jgi:methionine synthase II (cobalamin-independent)
MKIAGLTMSSWVIVTGPPSAICLKLAVGLINSYNTKLEDKQESISELNNVISNTKPDETYVTTNFDLQYLPKDFAVKKILRLGEISRGVKSA